MAKSESASKTIKTFKKYHLPFLCDKPNSTNGMMYLIHCPRRDRLMIFRDIVFVNKDQNNPHYEHPIYFENETAAEQFICLADGDDIVYKNSSDYSVWSTVQNSFYIRVHRTKKNFIDTNPDSPKVLEYEFSRLGVPVEWCRETYSEIMIAIKIAKILSIRSMYQDEQSISLCPILLHL